MAEQELQQRVVIGMDPHKRSVTAAAKARLANIRGVMSTGAGPSGAGGKGYEATVDRTRERYSRLSAGGEGT